MKPILCRVPPSSDFMVWKQIIEDEQYEVAVRLCDKDSPITVFDLGANIGLSSRYFEEKLPKARIFAVELDTSNFELLRQNTNVKALCAGVWSHNCDLAIGRDYKDKKEWSYYAKEENGTGLPGYSIEALMEMFNVLYIDFLKMDIEGGEIEVFKNPTWLEKVGVIAIEVHEGCEDVVRQALKEHKFDFFRHGELTIGQRRT